MGKLTQCLWPCSIALLVTHYQRVWYLMPQSMLHPLVICCIAMERSIMLLIGKLTISMAMLIAMLNYQGMIFDARIYAVCYRSMICVNCNVIHVDKSCKHHACPNGISWKSHSYPSIFHENLHSKMPSQFHKSHMKSHKSLQNIHKQCGSMGIESDWLLWKSILNSKRRLSSITDSSNNSHRS